MRTGFFCELGMLGSVEYSWQEVIPEPIFDRLYRSCGKLT